MDELIEALTIIKKYVKPGSYQWTNPLHCEHDELWVTACQWSDISEEDQKRLEELSFFEDDYGGLKSYRFGSS